jgi:hypothetical protein
MMCRMEMVTKALKSFSAISAHVTVVPTNPDNTPVSPPTPLTCTASDQIIVSESWIAANLPFR